MVGNDSGPAAGNPIAAWPRRVAARIGWQPDLRTAAVLIGALFLYLSILSLRTVPVLINDLQGYCGGDGAGIVCSVPTWVTTSAAIGLVATAADLLVVAGAVTLLLGGVPRGRPVTEAGVLGVAVLQVAVAINRLAANNLGISLASVWAELLTAVAALLLAAFVTLLRDD